MIKLSNDNPARPIKQILADKYHPDVLLSPTGRQDLIKLVKYWKARCVYCRNKKIVGTCKRHTKESFVAALWKETIMASMKPVLFSRIFSKRD